MKLPLSTWRIEPDHDAKGHFYKVNGARYPSVTTVLGVLSKPALLPWVAKMVEKKATAEFAKLADATGGIHTTFSEVQGILEDSKKHYRDVKDDAADVGSFVHAACEAVMLGEPADAVLRNAPKGAEEGFASFMAWKADHDVRPERVETYLASKRRKVAGCADFLGTIDGKRVIADWKSSTGIYDEYRMQVAAYAKMVEEMTGTELDGAMILRFDKKTGIFNPKKDVVFLDKAEVEARAKAFLGLVVYWHNIQK